MCWGVNEEARRLIPALAATSEKGIKQAKVLAREDAEVGGQRSDENWWMATFENQRSLFAYTGSMHQKADKKVQADHNCTQLLFCFLFFFVFGRRVPNHIFKASIVWKKFLESGRPELVLTSTLRRRLTRTRT